MYVLRELLDGHAVKFHGEFIDVEIDPPRVGTVSGRSPLFYFGGPLARCPRTAPPPAPTCS